MNRGVDNETLMWLLNVVSQMTLILTASSQLTVGALSCNTTVTG